MQIEGLLWLIGIMFAIFFPIIAGVIILKKDKVNEIKKDKKITPKSIFGFIIASIGIFFLLLFGILIGAIILHDFGVI